MEANRLDAPAPRPTAALQMAAPLVPEFIAIVTGAAIVGRLTPRRAGRTWSVPTGGTRHAVHAITALGYANVQAPLSAGAAIVLAHRAGSVRPMAVVSTAAIGAGTAVSLLRRAVPIQRPAGGAEILTSSYPSGHMAMSTAIYGAIVLLAAEACASRRVRVATVASGFALMSVIGGTRIVLNKHWAPDVAAGAAIGVAWLGCVWRHVR